MAATNSIPKELGDFEILRELGRGGMGVVYEARQKSLNRRVALKVLASSLGLTAKAVMRFKREAEAAAKLHHTNIVPIYFTGEEDGVYFYAMELIDGPSLDQVIRHMRAGGEFETSQDAADDSETLGLRPRDFRRDKRLRRSPQEERGNRIDDIRDALSAMKVSYKATDSRAALEAKLQKATAGKQ